jgi:histidinol dehydrogenase
MPAGPSEVLVIADETANISFVAADLLAQAEHDEDARAILVTTNENLARQVIAELNKQAKKLNRQAILKKSLAKAWAILAQDLQEALSISNTYAPEHLILQINNPKDYLQQVHNAGSVFIGPWSAEALGDYASGSNHVLPTYGYAKSYSGIGVEAFMKAITQAVETLTTLEGLDAHKLSVLNRVNSIRENNL